MQSPTYASMFISFESIVIDTQLLKCCRLDNLIMEAIATLKEPGGSNKTAIGAYIEVFSFNSYLPCFS